MCTGVEGGFPGRAGREKADSLNWKGVRVGGLWGTGVGVHDSLVAAGSKAGGHWVGLGRPALRHLASCLGRDAGATCGAWQYRHAGFPGPSGAG